MRIKLVCVSLMTLVLLLSLSKFPMTFADTVVGGKVTGQVTWSAADSPFVCKQNLEVPAGSVLKIEPGVELRLQGQTITVSGSLIAKGTQENPIVITSQNKDAPRAADWGPLVFQSGSDQSVLELVTVEFGKGLILHRSNPKIENCTIRHNHKEYGGGIYAIGSKPVINNCQIKFNVADRNGGGIRTIDSELTVRGCVIANNSAHEEGGGVSVDYNVARIEDNTISSNWAAHGGGIATGATQVGQTSMSGSSHSRPTIRNNRIINNWALYDGGGIHVTGTPEISHNLVVGNRIQSPTLRKEPKRSERSYRDHGLGAGVLVEETYGGPLTIQNNTIAGNRGAFWGAAIATCRASGKIEHNHIFGNVALENGGAISLLLTTSSKSFVSPGHGNDWSLIGNDIRANSGSGILFETLDRSGKQAVTLSSNNLIDNLDHQVVNDTQAEIQATNNYWGTENSDDIAKSVVDYYDHASRGRVIVDKPGKEFVLPDGAKLDKAKPANAQPSAEMLKWLVVCPEGFRAGQGLTRLPDTPPSITATWKADRSSKTAGYLVHIARIAPQFREVDITRDLRVVTRCAEGESPLDVGNVTRTVLTGFEIGQYYELSVSAYDFDGNVSAVSESTVVKVER